MLKRRICIFYLMIFMCFLCSCSKKERDNEGMIVVGEGITLENEVNQIFYGEWEVTDCIYVDRVPVNGIEYTDEEVQVFKESILKESLKKIQFTQSEVVLDGSEKWENVKYNMIVFPADDDYKIHFTMQLADIGLTESNGEYYLLVEVKNSESAKWDEICFFVKNQNEIILYKGSYCVLYERKSFEGGNQEFSIIKG